MIGAIALFAIASAAPAARPVLTVRELVGEIADRHRKTVRVRGWLGRCGGLSCPLASEPGRSEDRFVLSIAHVSEREAELASLSGAEIVLEAVVDASCRSGEFICLDRAPELTPLRVVRVLTPPNFQVKGLDK